MTVWVGAHALECIFGWYVFSAVVSGMPPPEPTSGLGYRWSYHSLHILAGDLSHYLQDRLAHRGTESTNPHD